MHRTANKLQEFNSKHYDTINIPNGGHIVHTEAKQYLYLLLISEFCNYIWFLKTIKRNIHTRAPAPSQLREAINCDREKCVS